MAAAIATVCEACGSRRLVRRAVEGVELLVCELCDALHGDDAAIEQVELRQEARERGFDPDVYPLVRALERVPTFKVAGAAAGDEVRHEYPFVFLRLEVGGLVHMERLLRGLLFVLRPRFWKRVGDITSEDIRDARLDLAVLARTLARDTALPWWGLPL
jgi:hypothetical protein